MRAAEDYGVNFINMADAVRHTLFTDVHFLPQYLTKTQFMRAPLLDGLVTWASSLCDYMPQNEIQALFARLLPLPMVDIGYLDIPNVPSIRIDNGYAIHLLVRHLVKEHGFTRIAFMGARSSRPHELRRDCFRAEMHKRGLDACADMIFMADSLDEQDVAVQVEALLSAPQMPQAILTSSDIIAAHVIDALEKRGISVPDDLVVTGFNNQLAGITAPCPVTTIDLAYFARGYQAVELLLDRIQYPASVVLNRTVKTSLVVRQSCGCFEQSIVHTFATASKRTAPQENASEHDVRAYLASCVQDIFPHESPARQEALVTAIIQDYTNFPPPPLKNTGMVQDVAQGAAAVRLRRNHYHAPCGLARACKRQRRTDAPHRKHLPRLARPARGVCRLHHDRAAKRFIFKHDDQHGAFACGNQDRKTVAKRPAL